MSISYRNMLVKSQVMQTLVKVDDHGDSCIYFLTQGEEIVYIGQTISFKTRLKAHLATDKIFDSYSVFSVEHEKMFILEAFLIMFYKPKYNFSESLGRVSIPIQVQDILDVLLENFNGRTRVDSKNGFKPQ